MTTENKCGMSVKMLPGETRKEYLRRWQREYRKANRERLAKEAREKRAAFPEKMNEIARRSHHKNKHKHKARRKKFAAEHKAEIAAYQKAYRLKNKEKRATCHKKYVIENKSEIRENERKYLDNRLKTDPTFKLIFYMRSRMREALKATGANKAKKTFDLLGCSGVEFQKHLESQFEPGWTWENYGSVWTVDHISPLSAFDLTKPHQQRLAFHYSNCRPLDKIKNRDKGGRILDWEELAAL